MLNVLWPLFIIASFVYAIFSGRVSEINNSIFTSVSEAVELSMTLLRNNMLMEWLYANCSKNKFKK